MSAQLSKLANGFRVATDQMPGLKSAAVAVHVKVGARNESARLNGIAHFLEHMAFKGTRTRSAIQISETIEEVGGFLNAYTSRESTVYQAGVLEDDVPLAIELIADILRHSIFDPNEIEVERGVILSEIGEYEDSPVDVVFDALQRTIYPEQQFGRPIIGTSQTVSSFRQPDFRSFVDKHYGPERMILTVAGSVQHDQIVRLAEAHFGDAVPQKATRRRRPHFVGGEYRKSRDIEQAQFAFAFPGPSLREKISYVARVFGVVLGGGSSSRLFTEAREKRGLCYSVSSHAAPGPDTGLFVLHASTGARELGELVKLCADEIRRSADTITAREVERAKTQIRVAILMGAESPANRIERMGSLVGLRGQLETLEATIARYDSVTLEAVAEYAHALAGSQSAAMAVYGPVQAAPSRDDFLGWLQS